MKYYVTRDKDGCLYLHEEEPIRKSSLWCSERQFMELPKDKFPEVTWENSPKKVKIELE